MATDPYGFSDDTASGLPLNTALWYAVGSCICAAVGMCACYMPFFVGAPLGLYGAWQANKVLGVAKDERDRSVATAAVAAGLTGGLVSSMFAGFILLYVFFIVLYMLVLTLALGAGAASQNF